VTPAPKFGSLAIPPAYAPSSAQKRQPWNSARTIVFAREGLVREDLGMTASANTELYATRANPVSDSHLHMLDVVGFIVAAIITLGPLAATAVFAH